MKTRKPIVLILLAAIIGLAGTARSGSISEFFDDIAAKIQGAPAPHVVPATGTIEVAFSPKNGGTETVVKAIDEARHSILVQAYSFTSTAIAKALVNAKNRGVDVKAILDKSQLSERYTSATFISNHDIPVRIDTKHAIAHNKIIIVDDINVVTGSFNFTRAAEERNAENVLVLRGNEELAKLFVQNWKAHWGHSDEYRR